MAASRPHVDVRANGNENSTKSPADKQFLDTFWKLAVPSDNERISGATTLLQILIKKQNETKEDKYCSEVTYSLRRLVRGLASSRKGARQGYAIALTEEEKEYAFGQVFAYLAVIQSGRLNEHNGASSVHILEQLLALSQQKTYLQLICLQGVIDLIKRSSAELFTDHIWPVLKADMKQGWEEVSPNNLALLMVCRQKFPDVVKSKFLQSHYGHADLVHPSNFSHIIRILTKSTLISHPIVHPVCDMLLALVFQDSSKVIQFWKIVVDDGLCTSKHETKYLAFSLLERAVPLSEAKQLRALFSEKLIRSMINNLANKQAILHSAAVKLSENLANAVKNIEDPMVQFAVAKCLLSRPGHVKFDDITKSKTVYSIISNFNCRAVKLYLKWLKKLFHSGTASIGHRMQEPNLEEDRKWICMQVLTLIKNPKLSREEDWLLDATRFLFLHAFFTVDKPEPSIPECSSVLETQVSAELQKMIGSQFYGALGVLSAVSLKPTTEETESEERSTSPEGRNMGTTSSGELWVSLLGHYAQDLLTCESVSCNAEFPGKAQDAWSTMMESVAAIQKKSTAGSAMSSGLAFQLLFLHVGLQMFSEPKQSADILQDLQSCYKRSQQKRRSVKKDQDEPEWVEVIVEILLSLLSKPSHLLRTVVDIAFKMVCPHMTQPALQQLLDVLDPTKSNVQVGQESDEEEEEEEEEEDDEDDEDEEEEDGNMKFTQLKSKKPLTNGNGHKKHKNADSDDSEEEDDEDDDDDEDEEDEDPAMKEQIKAALGNAAADSDGEDSGTDFELDDDAMLAHDDALSKAFKAMSSRSRKSKKEASTIMLHFKLRVLDLLDIFIKRQQNNPLLLDLVVPLLKVIESSAGHKDNQLLAEKALNIYRNKLCKVKRYPHNLSDHKDDIHDTIEELITIAKKAHSMTIVSLVSTGCLFLMRVLRGNVAITDPSPLKTRGQRAMGSEKKKGKKKGGKEEEEEEKEAEEEPAMGLVDVGRITGLYTDALEDFTMHRATCLHPNLFTDLIDRFPALAWHLSDTLTTSAQNGVQLYRRTQACRMLTLLLSKRPYSGSLSSWPKVSKHILSVATLILQGMLGEGSQFKAKSAIQFLHAVQQCAVLSHHLDKVPDFGEISPVLEMFKERSEVKRSGEFRSALDTAIAAIENRSKSSKKGKKKRKKSRKRRKSASTSSV
ncbi:myb-binding protein 1A-like protein isoform X2 [Strongylocentrotus purpuratus]|uniref:Myb-binding protein 1A n=1 Tax=Strongylocentrotus purpuratus TaxID=7668 RepID=A0A7M7T1S9_STRPU|nr:myb-binding protein 1A-like protein isoform X2 [Strongylocentrotus purpuratus]